MGSGSQKSLLFEYIIISPISLKISITYLAMEENVMVGVVGVLKLPISPILKRCFGMFRYVFAYFVFQRNYK